MNNSYKRMSATIKSKVIGIDVGVAITTIAVVDLRGTILAKDSMPTTGFPMVNNFVEALSERIILLAEANGGYENIRSVGISAPSANYISGCIENASNMPWKGIVPLAAMLRDRIGLAVALGNDAHASAMGEYVYGSAHGMENFIVISLGHGGLGSCFFSNGQPHLGYCGSAGEVGHTCVEDHGRLCTCGHRGCLEEYASCRGIIQTARELLEASDEPSLLRDLKELTPMTIGECCDQGDAMAKEVYRRTGFLLGLGLSNYVTVINPEAIILTGELTKASKWLLKPLEESFDEHVFGNIRGKVKLVVSVLNDDERDVLGASALAWTVKEYSLFK
jgi:glucokinase